MTPHQESLVRAALTVIARSRAPLPTGFHRRISRDDMVNIARIACDELGWDYYIVPGAKPQEEQAFHV